MKCLAIFAVLIAFNPTAFADDAPRFADDAPGFARISLDTAHRDALSEGRDLVSRRRRG